MSRLLTYIQIKNMVILNLTVIIPFKQDHEICELKQTDSLSRLRPPSNSYERLYVARRYFLSRGLISGSHVT
jgi:hypothetical protein